MRVLASVAKLTQTPPRPFTRHVDRLEVGRDVVAYWLDGAERMARLASSGMSVLHLHHRQIIAAPVQAACAVYRHCDLELTARQKRQKRAWLATHAQTALAQLQRG